MLTNERTEKRDPRVKRTDQLLKQTLEQLLGEKDFRSITVQDIVERADINRATFYAHFEDKFALLNYSVEATLQQNLENRSPNVALFSMANLRALAASVFEFGVNEHCHPSNRNLGPVLIAPRVQQFIYDTLLGWLRRAEADALLHTASPEQAAMALSWVISGARFGWLRRGRHQPSDAYVDETISVLKPMLRAYFV